MKESGRNRRKNTDSTVNSVAIFASVAQCVSIITLPAVSSGKSMREGEEFMTAAAACARRTGNTNE